MHACNVAMLHTFILAYLHTCVLTNLHTCLLAYMHTCIHAYLHICIITYLHTCGNIRMCHFPLFIEKFIGKCFMELPVTREYIFLRVPSIGVKIKNIKILKCSKVHLVSQDA